MEDKTQKSKLVEEEPLLPPPNRDRMRNLGEGNVKTFIISLVTTVVVLALMTFAGGVGFVTKQDFAKNMAGTVATLEQAKVDLAKAKSDVASAIQSVPTAITAQVNSSITLATGQWNSQLSALSEKVSGLVSNEQTHAGKISDLTAKDTTLTTKDTELSDKISVLGAEVKALQDRITALEKTKVVTTSLYSVWSDNWKISLDTSDNTSRTLSDTIELDITNNTGAVLDDIDVDFAITIDGLPRANSANLAVRLDVNTRDISKRKIDESWDNLGYNVEFRIQKTGLNIAVGKTKTITFTLSVENTIAYPQNTRYDYFVDVTPYIP